MSYASDTSVSVERSRADIERLVGKFGASRFASGWDEHGGAFIAFVFGKRAIRFQLEMPDRQADEFWATPGGRRRRNAEGAYRSWEQACRSRWRALLLVIKAKLEAVEVGIATIEQEFMAFTVVPGTNGRTLGEVMLPQIAEAIEKDKKPQLLLPGGA